MKKAEKSEWSASVREMLLRDQTTGGRIVWAVDDYAPLGPEFAPQRELTAELRAVLRPRAQKQQEQKTRRTRARGEVFTPRGSVPPRTI